MSVKIQSNVNQWLVKRLDSLEIGQASFFNLNTWGRKLHWILAAVRSDHYKVGLCLRDKRFIRRSIKEANLIVIVRISTETSNAN